MSDTTTLDNISTILDQRGKRYGTFEGHARVTQQLKTAIYNHAAVNGIDFQPFHREAIDMICHKLGRIANGDPNYDDSWVDIAGYSQLVVDILNGEGR